MYWWIQIKIQADLILPLQDGHICCWSPILLNRVLNCYKPSFLWISLLIDATNIHGKSWPNLLGFFLLQSDNQTLHAWHFHESNTGFAAIYYHSTVRLVEDVSGNLWAMLVATQSMSTRDMHETQTQCKTPKMQP